MQTGYRLDEGETVITRTLRHWIDLAPSVVAGVVLVVLAIAGTWVAARYHSQIPTQYGGIVAIFIVVMVVLGFAIFLSGLFVYRQNYLLLTNMHLIQVTQRGLFNRSTAQLSLSRVQDVSGNRNGLLATILNFGDVVVQSAGEEDNFIFRTAPAPQELADKCLAAHEVYVKAQPDAAAE